MESACSKIDKLQTLKTSLCNILDFLKDYFPLINAHSNDFICEDQWETTLPEPMRTQLLNLSEKTLCELPMLGYSRNQKLKSHVKACTASLTDLHLETGCPACKTETLTGGQLFEEFENVTKFCQQAWKCSIEGLCLAITVEDIYKNVHHRPKHSAVPLTGHFMNQKKSHEVEKMAELCAFLAENYSCKLVVDIGSGKGYLGSHLFLQHGLSILGIDAITTNTAGAIWRRDKLRKQWNGLLQRAKDTENGKRISHKERKRRSRENKFNAKMNSRPDNYDLYPDYPQQNDSMQTFNHIQTSQTRNLSPMYVPITMYVNTSCSLTEVARCAICEYEQDTFKKEQGSDTGSLKCVDNLGNITNNERAEDVSNTSKTKQKTIPNKSVSMEYQKNSVLSENLSEMHDVCNYSFHFDYVASENADCDHFDKGNELCQQTTLDCQKKVKSHDTFLQNSNPNFDFGIGKDSNSIKSNSDLACESSNSILTCEAGNYVLTCEYTTGIKELEMSISYPSVDDNNKEISKKLCTDSQTITETNPNLETKAGESYSSCNMQMKEANDLHRDQWKFEADLCPMMLTGLHTCGDLGSSMLELFVNNPDVAVLCGVSCCYHLIHEKFSKEEETMEDYAEEGSPYIAFPLSSFLQERRVLLGPKAKYLASQSVYRITQSCELQGLSFFPRALLQVILQDVTGHTTDRVMGLRKLTQQCDDIYQYIQTAFQRLKIPQDKISTHLIDEYLEKYGHMRQKLAAFFQLRATLAPCIEAIILLDRVCYLLEQENIADVHLVQLFDPVMSPRCYGIVAVKKST
ncbi:hypothetical protein CHS0354_021553 [Potamilus streckersoni]|uniref:Methyltransferase domain-containing protein n=1 Tax=Potamilus streckersoni TaxID=2493646 RepID=A0AAE0SNF4_9BIVA|nr:hypothetical protein CHS0354_021553 [Potamilus streckersoni]